MTSASAATTKSAALPPKTTRRWSVVDLVVVAVVGSTFGVIYWAWNQVWFLATPLFIAFPPGQALLYGVWMLPQVLAAFLVRRRGAAIFAALTAVVVSSFLGNLFGLTVLLYGLVQGTAAEAVFAAGRYRSWNWLTAGLATMLAAIAGTTLDVALYFPIWESAWKLAYVSAGAFSGLLLGAVLVPITVRRLANAGALEGLPAGQAARR